MEETLNTLSVPVDAVQDANIEVQMLAISAKIPYEMLGPIRSTPDGGVTCRTSEMEIDRPYPYKLGESWFVAVRHPRGVKLYSLR